MRPIEQIAWSDADHDLWAGIAAHDFEPAGDALTFTARLARDHDRSLAVARAAVEEYRRFCFLATRADAPVTPSETVDEVWHQHLTFSRDYWQVWCPTVLGRPLHHQPTKGGADENRRFVEQYQRFSVSLDHGFQRAIWASISGGGFESMRVCMRVFQSGNTR